MRPNAAGGPNSCASAYNDVKVLNMKLLSRAAICHLITMCACFAQLSSGRISGTVTDTSGAVIPGASITVTNQATELSWKVTSDSKGFYMVTNLPSGAYNVN